MTSEWHKLKGRRKPVRLVSFYSPQTPGLSIFFGLWGKKKDGHDEVEKFFEIKEEGGL